jgi:hypothetical protein
MFALSYPAALTSPNERDKCSRSITKDSRTKGVFELPVKMVDLVVEVIADSGG